METSSQTLDLPTLDAANTMTRPVGILHVKVNRATKLRKKLLMDRPDVSVKLKLTDDKAPSKKTSVMHKNLNPEWYEEFDFPVRNPETQLLVLDVYDWQPVGSPNKMGMNFVPLKVLTPNEVKEFSLDLLKSMDPDNHQNEKSRGNIIVELTYKPHKDGDLGTNFDSVAEATEGTPVGKGVLLVVVHECRDLEGKHHTNPSARIIFRGEEKKTKTVKNDRNPRWGEEIKFVVEDPPTNDTVRVEVYSTSSRIGLLHPKEALGYIDISLSDVVHKRRVKETYNLINSENGQIEIELQWRA